MKVKSDISFNYESVSGSLYSLQYKIFDINGKQMFNNILLDTATLECCKALKKVIKKFGIETFFQIARDTNLIFQNELDDSWFATIDESEKLINYCKKILKN